MLIRVLKTEVQVFSRDIVTGYGPSDSSFFLHPGQSSPVSLRSFFLSVWVTCPEEVSVWDSPSLRSEYEGDRECETVVLGFTEEIHEKRC